MSLIKTVINDEEFTCDLEKISCRFLNKLTDDVAIKKFYNNFNEAYHDAKKGFIVGFIEFKSNFSKSQQYFLSKEIEIDDNILNDREIKIYLDETNSQHSVFLRRNFYEVFREFSFDLMKDCNYPTKLESTGINFMNPFFGSFGDGIRTSIAPTFIIVLLFLASSYETAMLFIEDRQSGIWNRSILLGVEISELIIAHAIMHLLFILLTIIEILVVGRIVLNLNFEGNYLLVLTFFIVSSLSGQFFGMYVSCVCNDIIKACLILTGVSQSTLLISGIFWPMEGMPQVLRYFSYILPFTTPSRSLQNIIMKGHNLRHFNVSLGLFSQILWILLFIILIKISLKTKKFT